MLLILSSKKTVGNKTKEFFRLLGNRLQEKSVSFSISSFQDIEVFLSKEASSVTVSGESIKRWTTIFPRKVDRHGGLAFILANEMKKNGGVFVDLFRARTNDLTKLVQMYLFHSQGLSIPKTYYSPTYVPDHLKNALNFLPLPIVIKQCNTSKGSGVALAQNKKELREKIDAFLQMDPSKEILLQEFIPNTFEYRIFVTGNRVATAEKKTRTEKESFRNNVHLGAHEEFLAVEDVSENIRQAALHAAKITDIQIGGVDIVEDATGTPIIFEVNSCPAFTLDETISPEIKSLAEYLASCEKNS